MRPVLKISRGKKHFDKLERQKRNCQIFVRNRIKPKNTRLKQTRTETAIETNKSSNCS